METIQYSRDMRRTLPQYALDVFPNLALSRQEARVEEIEHERDDNASAGRDGARTEGTARRERPVDRVGPDLQAGLRLFRAHGVRTDNRNS